MNDAADDTEQGARARVLAAASALLARDGRDALTTRAVAAAAGIQAPTLYRLFGDKQGLIEAVAEHGFTSYLRQKRAEDDAADPVDDLRRGWDLHVGFGLANPTLFVAMYGDPRPGRPSPASARALAMLRQRMHILARHGRLRVSERRAAEMLRAAACGLVFTLLETPEAERDAQLSEAVREAIIAAIATDRAAPAPSVASAATTLQALLSETDLLSEAERQLLGEWLDRLSGHAASTAS